MIPKILKTKTFENIYIQHKMKQHNIKKLIPIKKQEYNKQLIYFLIFLNYHL